MLFMDCWLTTTRTRISLHISFHSHSSENSINPLNEIPNSNQTKMSAAEQTQSHNTNSQLRQGKMFQTTSISQETVFDTPTLLRQASLPVKLHSSQNAPETYLKSESMCCYYSAQGTRRKRRPTPIPPRMSRSATMPLNFAPGCAKEVLTGQSFLSTVSEGGFRENMRSSYENIKSLQPIAEVDEES
eukprot:augustus_masked-scaffold_48-processed-gene-1.26-mRNA-1 protein AED:1.00 eAED:1.00 QI:0/-1/0/0/-1/1/1/0/186